MIMPENLRSAPSLCLASQSPARRKLLAAIGLDCLVMPMDIDETRLDGECVTDYVSRLALCKAEAAFSDLKGQLPSLGADTVIVCREQLLTKPADSADAIRMLELLSGCTHHVYTGAAIVTGSGSKEVRVGTEVTFGELTELDIKRYVESKEPFGKAGAYAIQGRGQALISGINGSYSNVVGLPLFEVRQLLKFARLEL